MKGLVIYISFFLLSLNLFQVQAINAFDVSVWDGEIDCFQCIMQQNYTYMIIEIYSSAKQFNKYINTNIIKAQQAGLDVDVYIFPDIDLNPDYQVNLFLEYLKQNNLQYNKVWFDVENNDNNTLWFNNCTQNVNFLQTMMQTALNYVPSNRIGIYAQEHYWTPIMCNSTQFDQYQLWWPRWNNQSNFQTFTPFGGWTMPVMKQIQADVKICCANTDLDWIPDTSDYIEII